MSSEPADARATRPGSPPARCVSSRGPNLYFPRPAVKVTLALPGYLDAPGDTLRASTPRPACAAASRARRVRAAPAGAPAARRAGGARPGHRGRHPPARCAHPRRRTRRRRRLAFVWRHRAGRGAGRGDRAGPRRPPRRPPFADAVADRAAASPPPAGRGRALVTPHIPVASVTGTNGKTTTTRLLAHICMTAGLRTGLELHRRGRRPGRGHRAGRLLRPGRGARRPRGARGADRHPRDRARRHAAAGHGRDPQRRLRRHQCLRRPPRPARHRHRRPARRGQGHRHPGHQAARLGGAQRRRPAGLGDARRHPGPPMGLHRRPRLAGRAGGPRGAAAGR